jgi:hypothetical protein
LQTTAGKAVTRCSKSVNVRCRTSWKSSFGKFSLRGVAHPSIAENDDAESELHDCWSQSGLQP